MAWNGRGMVWEMVWHGMVGVWYGMACHGKGVVWQDMAL